MTLEEAARVYAEADQAFSEALKAYKEIGAGYPWEKPEFEDARQVLNKSSGARIDALCVLGMVAVEWAKHHK